MSAAEKLSKATEDTVRGFVSKLSQPEQQQLLAWSEKALAIRNSSELTVISKLKVLNTIENGEIAKIIFIRCFDILKKKAWVGQSWARRLGFAGAATGLTFGGAYVGIATMGAGMGVPLIVMTAAGGVVLGAAIDEIKKEFAGSKKSTDTRDDDV